jgi:MFS family permease
MAEATTAVTKVFSGVLSDWMGKRKPLLVLGYGIAALTRPMFPLAATIELVFVARILDRVGKGIRGAPRDAMVADVTPPDRHGAAFGLRQSLDTVGAVLGPLSAIALMLWLADDIRSALWFAVVPALVCVALLIVAVREPEHHVDSKPRRFPINREEFANMPSAYWAVVAVGSVLTVARFSEAFLILRAQHVGLPLAWVPSVLVVMSVVYSAAAYPVGLLADRFSRRSILAIALAALIGADLALAGLPSIAGAMLGTALWGLHMGFSQGVLAALVADAAPEQLRGTAFGVFNVICGLMMLLASILAGGLWDLLGSTATFIAGAVLSALALLALPLIAHAPPSNAAS